MIEQDWMMAQYSLVPYPRADSSFVGYSANSMITMAIFMFITGLGLGIAVALSIIKKWNLPRMAYQLLTSRAGPTIHEEGPTVSD